MQRGLLIMGNSKVHYYHRLWQQPETAWQEQYACQQTAEFLRQQGFTVETFAIGNNLPAADNTVRAVYGSGHPIIGILGEYDALDGLGQEAVSYQKPIAGPGHGCGHNLMAAFGIAAAASFKGHGSGTTVGHIGLYGYTGRGNPAWQGAAGKHGIF